MYLSAEWCILSNFEDRFLNLDALQGKLFVIKSWERQILRLLPIDWADLTMLASYTIAKEMVLKWNVIFLTTEPKVLKSPLGNV